MRKDKLIRDYFGTQVFITANEHFSTPALICAISEIGAESIMFSIDYPFESIPKGCTWFDEHMPINHRDLVNIGRNNCLKVFAKLMEEPHGLQVKSPADCETGGSRAGEVEYVLYNKDWSRRLVNNRPPRIAEWCHNTAFINDQSQAGSSLSSRCREVSGSRPEVARKGVRGTRITLPT